MKLNKYSRADRHALTRLQSASRRKFKGGQDGLTMIGGQTFSVGAESGGIPVLDDEEDDDANPDDGDDDDVDEDDDNIMDLRALILLGRGPTPPAAKKKRRGKCWLKTGSGHRNVLLICLRVDGATASYRWEPIVGGGY